MKIKNKALIFGSILTVVLAGLSLTAVDKNNNVPGFFEQKNATQSPSNLPKVIWEGLVA